MQPIRQRELHPRRCESSSWNSEAALDQHFACRHMRHPSAACQHFSCLIAQHVLTRFMLNVMLDPSPAHC